MWEEYDSPGREAFDLWRSGLNDIMHNRWEAELYIISSDEDTYETGSDDDDVSVLAEIIEYNTSVNPKDRAAQRCEPFWCAGAPSPCYDPYCTPYEGSDRDGPGSHHVLASASNPKNVIERWETIDGQRQVKHTMCKKCYRAEKQHQRDCAGAYACNSRRAYNEQIDRRWRKFHNVKSKREVRVELATRRMAVFMKREAVLFPPEAPVAPAVVVKDKGAKKSRKSNGWTKAKRKKLNNEPSTVVSVETVCPSSATEPTTTTVTEPSTGTQEIEHGDASTAPPVVVDTRTPVDKIKDELVTWSRAVRTQLSTPDLKALCKANKLMVTGCTNELLHKLVMCKLHGSPGSCPTCGENKFECEYSGDSLVSLPARMNCLHMNGKVHCSYGVAFHKSKLYFLEAKRVPKSHAQPLVDTAEGLLSSFNISVGSLLA